MLLTTVLLLALMADVADADPAPSFAHEIPLTAWTDAPDPDAVVAAGPPAPPEVPTRAAATCPPGDPPEEQTQEILDADGVVFWRRCRVDGKRVGPYWAWWPDGTPMEMGSYDAESRDHGRAIRWYADGRLHEDRTWEHGRIVGTSWYFGSDTRTGIHPDDRPRWSGTARTVWASDTALPDRPFAGPIRCPTGTTEVVSGKQGNRSHCTRPDGTKHGPYQFVNGQGSPHLYESGNYADGKRHGQITHWFTPRTDGQAAATDNYCAPACPPRSLETWVHGRRHGPVKKWSIEGRITETGEYVEGRYERSEP